MAILRYFVVILSLTAGATHPIDLLSLSTRFKNLCKLPLVRTYSATY